MSNVLLITFAFVNAFFLTAYVGGMFAVRQCQEVEQKRRECPTC